VFSTVFAVWNSLFHVLKIQIAMSSDFTGSLLSEHEVRRIEWRSRNRLARGKITVLDGDPGLGKSTLLTDWSAKVTRGEALPDGEPFGDRRGVIMLSAEDDPSDTIRPRFEAIGGDPEKVLLLNWIPDTDENGEILRYRNGAAKQRWFGFPDDMDALEEAVEHMNAGLIIVDPLFAYFSPDVKSASDQDVRRALSPLALMAQRTGVSVILVRHLNKSGGVNALYRGGGSIGIVGLTRLSLLLGRSKNDPALRVLAGVKNNIGPLPPSLGFRLDAVPGTDIAKMTYQGVVPDTAQQLLLGEIEDKAEADEEDETIEWLREYLAAGPREKTDVMKNARSRGFSDRALKRAKAMLRLKSSPGGFGGAWVWSLPGPAPLNGNGYFEDGVETEHDEEEVF